MKNKMLSSEELLNIYMNTKNLENMLGHSVPVEVEYDKLSKKILSMEELYFMSKNIEMIENMKGKKQIFLPKRRIL